MVISRKFFLFFILISFLSCKETYYLKEGGLRPKDYRTNPINNKNSNALDYELIDTSSIYLAIGTVRGNKIENTYTKIDTTNYKWIYRFYSQGKVSIFGVYDKSLSKSNFNPKSGILGFFELNDGNELLTKTYVTTTGGPKFHTQKGIIKNDTIRFLNGNEYNFTIFVKMKVPLEWLKWEPDW